MNAQEAKQLKVGDRVIHTNTGLVATIQSIDHDGVVLRDQFIKKTKPTKNSWSILMSNWRSAPR